MVVETTERSGFPPNCCFSFFKKSTPYGPHDFDLNAALGGPFLGCLHEGGIIWQEQF